MADLSVYQRVKPLNRFEEERKAKQLATEMAKQNQMMKLQEMAIKEKELKQGGGATGELIRMLQVENPNLSNVDALGLIQTGLRKGIKYTPEGIIPMQGYAESIGKIGATQKGMEEEAKLSKQLELRPQITGATERAKSTAESENLLADMQAYQPKIESVVNKLSELGKKATYTKTGLARDIALRETGLPMSESGMARAEYIATVDNEILPLLRQTFGAQFTEREGASLRATLGDPNRTPQEKDAVLRAFINQKRTQIEALKRRTGQGSTQETVDYTEYFK